MPVFPYFLVGLSGHNRGGHQYTELAVTDAGDQTRHLFHADGVGSHPIDGRSVAFRLKREFGIDRVGRQTEQVTSDGIATAIDDPAGDFVDNDPLVVHLEDPASKALEDECSTGLLVSISGIEMSPDRRQQRSFQISVRCLILFRADDGSRFRGQRVVTTVLYPFDQGGGGVVGHVVANSQIGQPGTADQRDIKDGENGTVVLKALVFSCLPDRYQIFGGRQTRIAGDGKPFELNRSSTVGGRILGENEERWNPATIGLGGVEIIERSAQNQVPLLRGVVQFVPRRLIVTIVDVLSGIQINSIGPVFVLASLIKHHEVLIPPSSSRSEAPHISTTGQQPLDRLSAQLSIMATLVDGINAQICI